MLKMKSIAFSILISILLFTAGCTMAFSASTNSSAMMKGETDKSLTKVMETEYDFEEGQTVVFDCSSKVEKGSLEMKLLTDEGEKVCGFAVGKKEINEVIGLSAGTYKVVVDCKDFKGSYKISWKKDK